MSDIVKRLRESYSTDVFLMEVAVEIERLKAALHQVWDCEEGSCPTCKMIVRAALEDDDE